jgi:Actin like proteins N terminal domain
MIHVRKVIGIEIANSSVKAVTNGGKILYYPNTIKEVIDSDIDLALGNKKDTTQFIYKSKKYEVGMLGNAKGSGGKERDYSSEEFKVEAAIALSQLVETEDEHLYLVYGVPATSVKPHIIKALEDNLLGDYEVTQGKRVKKFHVVGLKVLAQPVGTLFSLVYDIYGNKTDIDPRKTFLIDDLGWHTRDIIPVSLSNGVGKPFTTNRAMSDFNSELRQALGYRYPNSDVEAMYNNLYDLDEALKKTNILPVRGEDIDVSKEIKALQNKFAKENFDELNSNFDIASYHQFPLTGGGYIRLEEAYRNQFPQKFHNSIYLVPNTALANATGFYIYGRKHFKV